MKYPSCDLGFEAGLSSGAVRLAETNDQFADIEVSKKTQGENEKFIFLQLFARITPASPIARGLSDLRITYKAK